jgi:hypothetical protein
VQVHFDAPSSIASPLLMLNVVNGKSWDFRSNKV